MSHVDLDNIQDNKENVTAVDDEDTVDIYGDIPSVRAASEQGSPSAQANNSFDIYGDLCSSSRPETTTKSTNQSTVPSSSNPPDDKLPVKNPPKKIPEVKSNEVPRLDDAKISTDLMDDCFLGPRHVEEKFAKLVAENKALSTEAANMKDQLDTALINMSRLWKTCKAEVKKKDEEIHVLQRKYDAIVFRRSMRSIPPAQLNQVLRRIPTHYSEEFRAMMEKSEGDCCNCKKNPQRTEALERARDTALSVRGNTLNPNNDEAVRLSRILPQEQRSQLQQAACHSSRSKITGSGKSSSKPGGLRKHQTKENISDNISTQSKTLCRNNDAAVLDVTDKTGESSKNCKINSNDRKSIVYNSSHIERQEGTKREPISISSKGARVGNDDNSEGVELAISKRSNDVVNDRMPIRNLKDANSSAGSRRDCELGVHDKEERNKGEKKEVVTNGERRCGSNNIVKEDFPSSEKLHSQERRQSSKRNSREKNKSLEMRHSGERQLSPHRDSSERHRSSEKLHSRKRQQSPHRDSSERHRSSEKLHSRERQQSPHRDSSERHRSSEKRKRRSHERERSPVHRRLRGRRDSPDRHRLVRRRGRSPSAEKFRRSVRGKMNEKNTSQGKQLTKKNIATRERRSRSPDEEQPRRRRGISVRQREAGRLCRPSRAPSAKRIKESLKSSSSFADDELAQKTSKCNDEPSSTTHGKSLQAGTQGNSEEKSFQHLPPTGSDVPRSNVDFSQSRNTQQKNDSFGITSLSTDELVEKRQKIETALQEMNSSSLQASEVQEMNQGPSEADNNSVHFSFSAEDRPLYNAEFDPQASQTSFTFMDEGLLLRSAKVLDMLNSFKRKHGKPNSGTQNNDVGQSISNPMKSPGKSSRLSPVKAAAVVDALDDTIDCLMRQYNAKRPNITQHAPSSGSSEASLLNFLGEKPTSKSATSFQNVLKTASFDGTTPDCTSKDSNTPSTQTPAVKRKLSEHNGDSMSNCSLNSVKQKIAHDSPVIKRIRPTLASSVSSPAEVLQTQIVEMVPVKSYSLPSNSHQSHSELIIESGSCKSFVDAHIEDKKGNLCITDDQISADERDIGNSDSSEELSVSDVSEYSKDSFIMKTSDEEGEISNRIRINNAKNHKNHKLSNISSKSRPTKPPNFFIRDGNQSISRMLSRSRGKLSSKSSRKLITTMNKGLVIRRSCRSFGDGRRSNLAGAIASSLKENGDFRDIGANNKLIPSNKTTKRDPGNKAIAISTNKTTDREPGDKATPTNKTINREPGDKEIPSTKTTEREHRDKAIPSKKNTEREPGECSSSDSNSSSHKDYIYPNRLAQYTTGAVKTSVLQSSCKVDTVKMVSSSNNIPCVTTALDTVTTETVSDRVSSTTSTTTISSTSDTVSVIPLIATSVLSSVTTNTVTDNIISTSSADSSTTVTKSGNISSVVSAVVSSSVTTNMNSFVSASSSVGEQPSSINTTQHIKNNTTAVLSTNNFDPASGSHTAEVNTSMDKRNNLSGISNPSFGSVSSQSPSQLDGAASLHSSGASTPLSHRVKIRVPKRRSRNSLGNSSSLSTSTISLVYDHDKNQSIQVKSSTPASPQVQNISPTPASPEVQDIPPTPASPDIPSTPASPVPLPKPFATVSVKHVPTIPLECVSVRTPTIRNVRKRILSTPDVADGRRSNKLGPK